MFEVARELNYHIEAVDVYDSLHNSITDVRIHRLHNVFLNFGIPAFTFTRSSSPDRSVAQTITLKATAEVLGKHLRAVSGIGHQLHHSSPFFLYSGPQKDISMGVFLPLIIGLISPLFVAVIDRFSVDYSVSSELLVLAYTFAAPFIVGLSSFVLLLQDIRERHPTSCSQSTWYPSRSGPTYTLEIVSALYLTHFVAGALIKKHISSKRNKSQGKCQSFTMSIHFSRSRLRFGIHRIH
jgi:hypothetical protein